MQRYFDYYNNHRSHSNLGYRIPSEVYFEGHDSLCPAYIKQKLVLTMGTTETALHQDYKLNTLYEIQITATEFLRISEVRIADAQGKQ
jgi:hypothetical protein